MPTTEPGEVIGLLLDALAEITEAASRLQDDDVGASEASSARDAYFEWYARALNVIPPSLESRFRDFFVGGQFTPRIQSFLSAPKAPNPVFDPTKPANPLVAGRYRHDFERAFRASADGQRQILIEARAMLSARGREVPSDGDIFIVHGHDEATLQRVARTVRTLTEREPVVLREQPNQGRTIIEKFEAHAAKCSFAIALLTRDDLGRAAGDPSEQPRARQNVVFEAGYFVGLLGRHRVVLLHEERVVPPSDLDGIAYVSLNSAWQVELAKELRAAGIGADLNRL